MARVLAVSSQVARGHVGLNAIVPALQRLGHEVVSFPTVLLSNHPAHTKVAGNRIAPELLHGMLEALEDNRWLGEIDAVLTGYMPSALHVRFAREAIERVRARRPDVLIVVDPVLGDLPKGLYIDADAAAALRDELVPLAHVVTPNAFELSWLTGAPLGNDGQARDAALRIGVQWLAATSVPATGGMLDNVLVRRDGTAWGCTVPAQTGVPNGTGDLAAALLVGQALRIGVDRMQEAFAFALAGVDAAIRASLGCDELQLVDAQADWAAPVPLALRHL